MVVCYGLYICINTPFLLPRLSLKEEGIKSINYCTRVFIILLDTKCKYIPLLPLQ